MPYLYVNILKGHSDELKGVLLERLSRETCLVLEAGIEDTHAYALEFGPADIRVGGRIPLREDAVLVTVVMSRGRPPEVLRALVKKLTEVVAETLGSPRQTVHCVLEENEAVNIAVGGTQLRFPRMPRWLFTEATR